MFSVELGLCTSVDCSCIWKLVVYFDILSRTTIWHAIRTDRKSGPAQIKVVSHMLLESEGEKNSVRVYFHRPIIVLVSGISKDSFPTGEGNMHHHCRGSCRPRRSS